MASSVNPLGSSANTGGTGTPNSAGLGSTAPSEEVFLTLLVSQLKNQDPLNPSDSTQFVTQLAQFSQLEQVIGIRNDTDQLAASSAASANNTSNGTSSNDTSANKTN